MGIASLELTLTMAERCLPALFNVEEHSNLGFRVRQN